MAPDLVSLAEDRINRTLRVRQMETALAETIIGASNEIAVPEGTVGVKTLWVPNYESTPLSAQPYERVVQLGIEGVPTSWAWQGDNFYFDGVGSVRGVLYQRVPALSDTATSNWLLTTYPSAYLFGALCEGWLYVGNEAEAKLWQDRQLAVLSEIQGNAMRDTLSGPLQVRAR
jgi:hypothetical protein